MSFKSFNGDLIYEAIDDGSRFEIVYPNLKLNKKEE